MKPDRTINIGVDRSPGFMRPQAAKLKYDKALEHFVKTGNGYHEARAAERAYLNLSTGGALNRCIQDLGSRNKA